DNDFAVFPDPAASDDRRFDGEFVVLLGGQSAVADETGHATAADDASVGRQQGAPAYAGNQLVRPGNRPDERLDALVPAQGHGALGASGDQNAVEVLRVDLIDRVIDVVHADFLEVAVDLDGLLRGRDDIDPRAEQLQREPWHEALFFLEAVGDECGDSGFFHLRLAHFLTRPEVRYYSATPLSWR